MLYLWKFNCYCAIDTFPKILFSKNTIMKKFIITTSILTSCLIMNFSCMAATSNDIVLSSDSIDNNKPIPKKFAYCASDGKGKTKDSDNISPQLSWSKAPSETKSFALVVVDPDVPAKFDNANKDGKVIAENFPRQNFYHWVMVNIPANTTEIAEGKGKDKNIGIALVNDFAGGKNSPKFVGYDGPCPPWNDVRLHHYHFTIYALDVETIKTSKNSSSREIVKEIEKHMIAKGELVGTYSNFTKK